MANRDRKGFFSPPSHTTPHTGPYGAIPKECRAVAGADLQPQTCTFILSQRTYFNHLHRSASSMYRAYGIERSLGFGPSLSRSYYAHG